MFLPALLLLVLDFTIFDFHDVLAKTAIELDNHAVIIALGLRSQINVRYDSQGDLMPLAHHFSYFVGPSHVEFVVLTVTR